jgi:hypothetical protein
VSRPPRFGDTAGVRAVRVRHEARH